MSLNDIIFVLSICYVLMVASHVWALSETLKIGVSDDQKDALLCMKNFPFIAGWFLVAFMEQYTYETVPFLLVVLSFCCLGLYLHLFLGYLRTSKRSQQILGDPATSAGIGEE